MNLWEIKQQAITRVSSRGTRAEWIWCVLRNGETIECYKDEQKAVTRLDELRMQDYES